MSQHNGNTRGCNVITRNDGNAFKICFLNNDVCQTERVYTLRNGDEWCVAIEDWIVNGKLPETRI